MNLPQPEWPRRWPTALVVGLATLGPVGRIPFAPGTWGTLVGVIFVAGALSHLPPLALLAIGLLLSWVAVGICNEAERRLDAVDPGCVILDEFAVMPLCFLGWPQLAAIVPAWAVFALGFALFRLLDIAKPLGIRMLQSLPGGWGVVADDFAAALGTCALLHIGIGFYALV
ncbi:MAG: phosphatidylglycerophosphatase A [Opitutaceae bacterium]